LQIGQRFTARVLQAQAEGQLVIELNRQSYIANSNLPLAAGQEFPVQVTQTGQPIQLKILGDNQQSTIENLLLAELVQAKSELATASAKLQPGTLLTLLKQIADTENPILSVAQIQQIQKLLTPIPIGPESQRVQQSLKNFVENSGIFFEAKLRTLIESLPLAPPLALPKMAGDLKVLLGNLQTAAARALRNTSVDSMPIQTFEEKNPVAQAMGTILEQRVPLMDEVIARQTEAAYRWNKDGTFCMDVPLGLLNQDGHARIRFHLRSKRSGSKHSNRPATIDIRLELQSTGRIEVWAQWWDAQIQAKLYVESGTIRDLFEPYLDDLQQSLAEAGFKQVGLEVSVDPVRLYRLETDAEPITAEHSLLSIRI